MRACARVGPRQTIVRGGRFQRVTRCTSASLRLAARLRPQGLCGAAFNRMRGPPRADRGVRVPGPSDGRCRGRPCIASSAACFGAVLFLISFTVHRLQPSVHYLTSHVTHDTARGERSRCRRAVTRRRDPVCVQYVCAERARAASPLSRASCLAAVRNSRDWTVTENRNTRTCT